MENCLVLSLFICQRLLNKEEECFALVIMRHMRKRLREIIIELRQKRPSPNRMAWEMVILKILIVRPYNRTHEVHSRSEFS